MKTFPCFQVQAPANSQAVQVTQLQKHIRNKSKKKKEKKEKKKEKKITTELCNQNFNYYFQLRIRILFC